MKKLLIYGSFGLAIGVMVASFITAKTYMQLAIASAIYPAIAYLGFKLFLDPRWNVHPTKQVMHAQPRPIAASLPVQKKIIDIVDIDKRAFLKLIAGTGISFFLFSLFAKKAEDILFPQSAAVAPGFGGVSAGPTAGQSMDGYRISEIDDSEITYYGFINASGAWFIMKEDPTSGSFRYAKGNNDFPEAWRKRKAHIFDYYHNLF